MKKVMEDFNATINEQLGDRSQKLNDTIGTITANGLSSSKLIMNADGTENKELSRRVEFRVLSRASDQMKKILEGIPDADRR